MAELDSKLRGALEPSLEAGEELRGVCVATQVGVFKGRQVAIGVSGSRLLIQGMNRKFEPDGHRSHCLPSASPRPRPKAPVAVGGRSERRSWTAPPSP